MSSASDESCEQAHQGGSMDTLRIGYEVLGAEGVAAELVGLARDVVMARAVAHWSSALKVHRATQPLRAARDEAGCSTVGGARFCSSSSAPRCGDTGPRIPERYLRATRTCSRQCRPPVSCRGSCIGGGMCACDVDDWAAQGGGYCCTPVSGVGCDCAHSDLTFIGSGTSGSVLCRSDCTEEPEGEGAVDEDLHVFVTLLEEVPGCGSGANSTLASSSWCVEDPCGRPTFAHINFCPSELARAGGAGGEGEAAGAHSTVTAAVHALAHAMAVSYEVSCLDGGASYDVVLAEPGAGNGTAWSGRCTAAGQTLATLSGLGGGEVTCVAPAELCQAGALVTSSTTTSATTGVESTATSAAAGAGSTGTVTMTGTTGTTEVASTTGTSMVGAGSLEVNTSTTATTGTVAASTTTDTNFTVTTTEGTIIADSCGRQRLGPAARLAVLAGAAIGVDAMYSSR